MKFSIVIPTHDEEKVIENTLSTLVLSLEKENWDYEILVIADNCQDSTIDIVEKLRTQNTRIRLIENNGPKGFGNAVRVGLKAYKGDAVAIFMADASDHPSDLSLYFRCIQDGAECVFGSRFIPQGRVEGYPVHKLILNRLANYFILLLFRHGLNDTTNAFKCYRREVIDGCRPFLSPHFNLTVELPLKAVIRRYNYQVVPVRWTNRKEGISKLKIREMGSRYLFIILYCFLERLLTGKDYHRRN